jgi:hypothetical protein
MSSTDASRDLSGPVIASDGAAIAMTALGLGVVLSKELSPIIAGAGPLIFLIGGLILAWPAATIARARGHHGPLRAAGWGVGLAAPFAFLALVLGAPGAAVILLGLGLVSAGLTWLSVKAQVAATLLLPERYRAVGRYVIASLVAVGVLVVLAQGFVPRRESERNPTVAAVEVPLRNATDRADLLAMLQRHAREEGLHVDDRSQEWMESRRQADPGEPRLANDVLAKTIYVGVWRGEEDKDMEVLVDDGGRQGRPWLMFSRGDQPELATRSRRRLQAKIKARWPDARDVPVMPSGALPLADDLVWTGESYVVKPERAAAYAGPKE